MTKYRVVWSVDGWSYSDEVNAHTYKVENGTLMFMNVRYNIIVCYKNWNRFYVAESRSTSLDVDLYQ